MNVYDFDKTIYKSDSSADFYFYSLKRHPSILIFVPEVIIGFIKYYVFRKGTKTQFKTHVMKFASRVNLQKDIENFWKSHKKKIKKFYLENQRDDDVIISASPEFILEPICKELGIKHLICSQVEPATGEFQGLNCHGKEKVRRFYEIFPQGEIDEFYSDSYSDTPLAEIANKAFIVKGEKLSPWKF
ncbi:MAG: HAD-IB family phosphatase [Eubacteriales bacterium]|nr:HAD-IB family phosphatase [Eubacteriales bacterium]